MISFLSNKISIVSNIMVMFFLSLPAVSLSDPIKIINNMPPEFPMISKSIKNFVPDNWHLQYYSRFGAHHIVVVQRNKINFDSFKNRFLILLKSEDEDTVFKVVVSTPNVLDDPAGFGRYGDTFVQIYPRSFGGEFDIVFYYGTNWNFGLELTFGQLSAPEMRKNDKRKWDDWRLKRGVGFRTVNLSGGKNGEKISEIFHIKPGILLSEFKWGTWKEIDKYIIPATQTPSDLKYLGKSLE